jgi:capsular polysaccharide biosynthesis protein
MAEITMVLGIKKKITLNFLLGFLLTSFLFIYLLLFSMISDNRVKNDGEMQ